MALRLTVKISDNAPAKQFENLQKKLTDGSQNLCARLGKTLEVGLKKHFRLLNQRPNKRGWKRLGFWNGIANSTSFVSADKNSATVAIQNGAAFAAKLHGANIRPKAGKKLLAIPAIESRYGVSPSSLDKNELVFLRSKKGRMFLGKSNSDGSIDVHYFLVPKAKTPKDPDALPNATFLDAKFKQTINRFLKI